MGYNCDSELINKISMNYNNEPLWTDNMPQKYNTFTIPLLYNGIYFDELMQSQSILFSYKFQNNDNKINEDFIKSLENFGKGTVTFKDNIIEINEPFSNYNAKKFKIYYITYND